MAHRQLFPLVMSHNLILQFPQRFDLRLGTRGVCKLMEGEGDCGSAHDGEHWRFGTLCDNGKGGFEAGKSKAVSQKKMALSRTFSCNVSVCVRRCSVKQTAEGRREVRRCGQALRFRH